MTSRDGKSNGKFIHNSRSALGARRRKACTAMLSAVQRQDKETVKLFLDSPDCEVNYCGPDKWTALLRAASLGNLQIFKILLDNKADVNMTTMDGKSPLIWACSAGHIDIVRMLAEISETHLNLVANNGWTALMFACHEGRADCVDILIQAGCDINFAYDGITALSLASAKISLDCARLLLENSCDVTLCDSRGWNPLIFAVRNVVRAEVSKRVELVELLIKHGTDLDHQDKDGLTTLMHLCKIGYSCDDLIHLLLNNSADPHISREKQPRTALEAAATVGNVNACRILLEFGCDPTRHNNGAIQAAIDNKHFLALSLLDNPTAQYGLPTKCAASIGGTVS